MEHDWVAIGGSIVAVILSMASLAYSIAAERRDRQNRL